MSPRGRRQYDAHPGSRAGQPCHVDLGVAFVQRRQLDTYPRRDPHWLARVDRSSTLSSRHRVFDHSWWVTGRVATSQPTEPRWAPSTPPAEQVLWRWAVEQLPGGAIVLPLVAMTVGHGGKTQEAEVDLVIVDPTFGMTIVEAKGGTVYHDASRVGDKALRIIAAATNISGMGSSVTSDIASTPTANSSPAVDGWYLRTPSCHQSIAASRHVRCSAVVRFCALCCEQLRIGNSEASELEQRGDLG